MVLENHVGSIVHSAPVDCIMNAANEDLKHRGGVACVIADACGAELVEESEPLVVDKGRLKVTQCAFTKAGNLSASVGCVISISFVLCSAAT